MAWELKIDLDQQNIISVCVCVCVWGAERWAGWGGNAWTGKEKRTSLQILVLYFGLLNQATVLLTPKIKFKAIHHVA